jgi:pyruvate-formate lyase-activating enzyme
VRELALAGLLDYAAVDVKVAPGISSRWLCGIDRQGESALKTLGFLVEAGVACEARTTVVADWHDADGLDKLARALAGAGIATWRLQPVETVRVLDPSVRLDSPDPAVLAEAVETASLLGIDASVRRPQPVRTKK